MPSALNIFGGVGPPWSILGVELTWITCPTDDPLLSILHVTQES